MGFGEGGLVLRRGPDRVVAVEGGGATVRKSFLGGAPHAALDAAAEYGRLRRFAAAVDGVDGVGCPRPLELVPGPVPAIRMERAAGTPLLARLRSTPLPAGERDGLAAVIATGVQTYVAAVGEPYFDLQFDNMLVVPGRASAPPSVVFVDFGVPDHAEPVPGGLSPLETSLGNLVGSTVFQSARPKWLAARRQHRQATELCAAVVDRVVGDALGAVSPGRLGLTADLAYRRSALAGGWGRRAWYGGPGYLVARRVRAAGTSFGPTAFPGPALPGHRKGYGPRQNDTGGPTNG